MQIQAIGTLPHRRFPTIAECSRPGRCHTEGSQTYNLVFCGQRGCLNCSVECSLRTMYNHTRFACRYIPTFLHATICIFVYRYVWYLPRAFCNHKKILLRVYAFLYNGMCYSITLGSFSQLGVQFFLFFQNFMAISISPEREG